VSAPTRPVAVVGAGSWGTALALHLERVGACPRLWGRDPELVREIRERGENRRYLTGIRVPPGVLATSEMQEALTGTGIVIVAVPSAFVEAVLAAATPSVPPAAVLVSATKGLEPGRGRRISVILAELFPEHAVAVLSGPSFAREVALGQPTALVVASGDESLGRALQGALAAPAFRLYTNRDVIGVELAGALKNVMAIATGLCDGLGLGENARAALITRGLAEIVRLGVALGAQAGTFLGLAGLGDLVLTCTGSLSRNHALGRELAAGRTLAEVEAATPMIAEGVRTVSSALAIAREAGVTMPICQALQSLLSREPRPEEEKGRAR
jgi:glycerol-3-phosphate dehydrogenase (NAD(P)+)